MKEWSKAVDDFQVSITQYANEPSVHSGLTEAYQNLGMFELATRHRKISEQLLSQRPQNAATPEVPQAPPE
jgi:hypothetical protein